MDDATYYSGKRVARITSFMVLGLSSILPLVAILALNAVQNLSKRLGIIAAFTIVFSTCLGLLTNARRVEVFAASAAYAAIQVVFIAGNGSGNSTAGQP
jgi:hypothetical protein